jgi:hypothetical protein
MFQVIADPAPAARSPAFALLKPAPPAFPSFPILALHLASASEISGFAR